MRIQERPQERILIVTLTRPSVSNAVNTQVADAFEALASHIEGTDAFDAIILTGEGDAFCGGGDLTAFKHALEAPAGSGASLPALLDELATKVHGALERLVASGPLIIGAINGPATGAGLGLVSACDFAYARPNATLRAGFSRLGLTPDTGSTYFLPRIVGYKKALELLLLGRPVSADEALSLGIYTELISVDASLFLEEVIARVRPLLASGRAVRATRELLRAGATSSLTQQLEREKQSLVSLASVPEVLAGVTRILSAGSKRGS